MWQRGARVLPVLDDMNRLPRGPRKMDRVDAMWQRGARVLPEAPGQLILTTTTHMDR